MFIGDVVNSGALPSLELTLRFAGRRQRLLAHNIANWTIPNFRPVDVSPAGFQQALSKAIDRRRDETGGASGDLKLAPTPELAIGSDGALSISPRTPSAGILAQDRNNSDLETMMKDQAENTMVFRVASELLRSRLTQLRDAIAERA